MKQEKYNIISAFWDKITNRYQKLNLLSVDVTAGALSSAIMVLKLLKVQMTAAWWFVLALSIWLIYTTDHLIDAVNLENPQGARRQFYAANFRLLKTISIVVFIIDSLVSLMFLDTTTIIFGIGLGAVTIVYLSMVYLFGKKKKIWMQKEFYVAVIYTAGIWGSAIIHSNSYHLFETTTVLLAFFILVLADILIFSVFEKELDNKNRFVSLLGIIGEIKLKRLIGILLLMSALVSVLLILVTTGLYKTAGFVFLTMAAILFFIFYFDKRMAEGNGYRYLGEAVFFLPVFYLFLN